MMLNHTTVSAISQNLLFNTSWLKNKWNASGAGIIIVVVMTLILGHCVILN